MKSIMHDKRDRTCYLCMILHFDYSTQSALEEHHVIYGRGKRGLSEKYGLKVYLCTRHHRDSKESIHNNTDGNRQFDYVLKQDAQQAFEDKYPNLNFREIFGKNYVSCPIKPKAQSNLDGFIEIEDGINESTEGMADL